MSAEVLLVRKFRGQIPKDHRATLDTRIKWLWNQRFGTVQMVWKDSPDVLDVTAATLILQAIMAKDLDSIMLIFNRIEGGSLEDKEVQERAQKAMRL